MEGRLQDELDICQEFGVANVFPDKQAIFQTIHARVFRQTLVEAAHWSQKNDRIYAVKVGGPGVSLSPDHVALIRQYEVERRDETYRCPRAANIVQDPVVAPCS